MMLFPWIHMKRSSELQWLKKVPPKKSARLRKVPPKVISAIDFNSAISLGVNFL